jgi:beta-lactamase regulating signal transducer with metallopeptidase domain
MTSPVVSIGSAILAGLCASVLDASIFACLVFAAIRLAKPAAATRHLLYWLVLAVAIAAPVASIAASLGRVQLVAEPAPSQPITAALPSGTAATETQHGNVTNSERSSDAPEIDLVIPPSLLIGSALGIWLSISAYKGIALCFELFALYRVKRRATALDRSRLATLRMWNANIGALRHATIAISHDVDVPCAAGLWAPSILLPNAVVEKQSAEDIDRIVMHEAAHLARYDDWTNVFERVLAVLLWFNPALAFARTRIAVDREIACDDWVVARIGGAHGYATCLFRLAEATRSARPTAHALGALGNTRHITERIEHLLSQPKLPPRRIARAVCGTLATAALALTIVQATQAPAIAIDEPASQPEAPAQPLPTASPASGEFAPAVPKTPPTTVAPVFTPAAVTSPPIIAAPQPTLLAPRLPVTKASKLNEESTLRAMQARLAEANRQLAIAKRKLALQQATLAHAHLGIASDPAFSAMFERLKRLQSERAFTFTIPKSVPTQDDISREVARGLSEALHERDEAENESRAGMREALRAQVEALRANVDAMRQSHLGEAEVQRAMQELREELKREGLPPNH